jgi:hypothetical protein
MTLRVERAQLTQTNGGPYVLTSVLLSSNNETVLPLDAAHDAWVTAAYPAWLWNGRQPLFLPLIVR